jgi:hypothetical protein
MIASALLALLAFAVQLAGADNGGGESEIEIKAPLDAVNCACVPPTITVLGLTLDISAAKFDDNDDEDESGAAVGCAGLRAGQLVEVELASDLPNTTTGLLTAVKVEAEDDECDDDDCVEIEAPIQTADALGQTITVLGLTIDISQAEIDGDDDEQGDDNSQGDESSAPTQLIAGQFVEVKLASSVPPLVATEIEVKNSGTGIEVHVVDQDGNEIDDDDNDVQVVVTVTPTPSAAVKSKATKGGKKTLTFTAQSKGHTVFNGLPAGRAKLLITRIHGGHKSSAKSSTVVQPQQTTHVVARLKQAK